MAVIAVVSESRTDHRLWHKATASGPARHGGRTMGTRYTLLCGYKDYDPRTAFIRDPADTRPGSIDDLGFGSVAVSSEPVDAACRPRNISPDKAKIRLCPVCFAKGTPS